MTGVYSAGCVFQVTAFVCLYYSVLIIHCSLQMDKFTVKTHEVKDVVKRLNNNMRIPTLLYVVTVFCSNIGMTMLLYVVTVFCSNTGMTTLLYMVTVLCSNIGMTTLLCTVTVFCSNIGMTTLYIKRRGSR
jgi:hypothetical protein